VTREIEERGEVEEVRRGGRLAGVVPPGTRDARPRAPRVVRGFPALRLDVLASRSSASPLPRTSRVRELADWLPFATLRRALGRERGVRWRTVPLPPLVAWADVTWIESSLASPGRGWKASLTPVLLRALASALQTFPRLNACFGKESAHAQLFRQVHLGVALYTARGLRIPVLRHADRKDADELEQELADLARRARQETPVGAERSATFCDLGALGREDLPEYLAATEDLVLGAGPVRGTPRRSRGRLEIRRLLPLTLSVGRGGHARADGCRLLRWLVRAIEDPRLLAGAR
jgi:pyruvate dehydrogenase E2 component (dihydrolipoamide acetyltransferase)